MYSAPHSAQPPQAPPAYAPVRPARRYPGLRAVASTCIISAWLTLALSTLGGIAMMAGGGLALGGAAAQPANPSGTPELGGGMSGGAGVANGANALFSTVLPGLKFAGGIMTLASGAVGFLFLIAIGLLIYVFIDMEENTRSAAAAMTAIARRMGMG